MKLNFFNRKNKIEPTKDVVTEAEEETGVRTDETVEPFPSVPCPVCGADCSTDAEFCTICGADLQFAKEQLNDMETVDGNTEIAENLLVNPVAAVSVSDPVEAEIFSDILHQNGIPCSVESDFDENRVRLQFGGMFSSIDIYTEEKDADTAKELYKRYENREFDSEEIQSDSDEVFETTDEESTDE